MEFRDLNGKLNAYQRKYVDEIRQIDDIQRKLAYLKEQCDKEEITVESPSFVPSVPRYREIVRLDTNISELEHNLRDVNEHLNTFKLKQLEFLEMNEVLRKTQKIMDFNENKRHLSIAGIDFLRTEDGLESTSTHLQRPGQATEKLHMVTGVIRADKTNSFHKMIWRICGNNVMIQFFDIETPIDDVRENEVITKKVFLIICQGDRLHEKVKKICDGFRAVVYPVPNESDYYRKMCLDVDTNLKDLKIVVDQTLKQKYRLLKSLVQPENLKTWCIQMIKLKAVFSIMNLFRKTEKGFVGECWCAKSDFLLLQAIINNVTKRSGIQGQALVEKVFTDSTPPTYYRLNKFTQGFQNIVDSYGVANYQEINPAPYTIITFPFLFAVMFADAGHGLLMALFALWMVLFEKSLSKKSNNEIWLTFFNGRYIILLMGFFSIYTGFIYNDVFAKAVNIFGTSFEIPQVNETLIENGTFPFDSSLYLNKTDTVYPFGVDAAWQLSENKIIFLNSFKMKLSVILGVTQMFFGVMLSLCNHFHFRNIVSIFFEFIPQVIFLLSLFGYLIFMIFLKWFKVFSPASDAPSILIDFINMFLFKYPTSPKYLSPWFEYKKYIQTVLLISALACIPIMLFVKPIIQVMTRRPKPKVTDMEAHPSSDASNEHDGDSAGDIFIHQAIHTIEYCLGSISHTASYLRLWALSLAHSQLSEVLWNMVMAKGFASPMDNLIVRSLLTYLSFGLWAVLTVAILIVMEGLSAFLHALRLHWVEFQSKFYIGAGFMFKPFWFKTILIEAIEQSG